MSANQACFPIAAMARVLGVSKAGYYAWLQRPPSARATADAALLKRIKTVHASSRQTYGAPRVHADLHGHGERHSRKRIARLMREAGLVGASHRHGGPTTTRRNKDDRPAPDLVDRDFNAAGPNRLWVADITYVPTMAGFLYLAVVLDAWSRKIVGWAMANHLRAELVLDAMEMAVGQRRPKDVIHHSDQGSQGGINWSSQHNREECCDDRLNSSSTRRWHSANAARKLACGRRWDRSATPTTTRCARVSSGPSNASCWNAAALRRRPRRRWPVSASSKAGTIRRGCIPPLATARPSPTNMRWRSNQRKRNQPSSPTLHENGAASRTPFAPASLQGLRRYYWLLRPCAPPRYSRPHGWSRLRLVPSRPEA